MFDPKLRTLEGKKGLVVGIANEHSIAWGCAKAFRAYGAELAITYLNEKAKPYVEPLAREVEAPILMPLDVAGEGQMEAVFDEMGRRWGRLDFALHSIAFAPKDDLHGRVVDCSRDGFLLAMDVSCHSFIRMARLAEPLMKDGGALFTMSYYGAEKVVVNYNLMGPVKAALEATARYLAHELGSKGIRVYPISPGPLAMTASGYAGVWATEKTREALFDAMERRETYATTGPRMLVRFFGGWEFEPQQPRAACRPRLVTPRACRWAAISATRRPASRRPFSSPRSRTLSAPTWTASRSSRAGSPRTAPPGRRSTTWSGAMPTSVSPAPTASCRRSATRWTWRTPCGRTRSALPS